MELGVKKCEHTHDILVAFTLNMKCGFGLSEKATVYRLLFDVIKALSALFML